MVKVLVIAALAATAAARAHGAELTRGADQPLYQPAPAWVKAVPIPFDMKPSGAAVDLLLSTVQGRYVPGDDETYLDQAVRVNSAEGLAKVSNLIETWDPQTQTLAIHHAEILRDGKAVDLLAGGRKFTVLRRETNLEAAMIDGRLTATLQPEGLRLGDVIHLAFTLTRKEPALAGHSEGGALVAHAGVVGRLFVRETWPRGRALRTWTTDDLPPLTPVIEEGWSGTGFDQRDAVSPEPPKGAPARDQLFGVLQLADFKDWAEVSATAFPLYDKASKLSPASPLNAEIARIRAANPTGKARALAALKLVEEQVRYLFVGLDAGGYTPAPADLTWTRRFGDCKGKTVLLLALLRDLGVEAEPALVSAAGGDGLDRRLPEMGAFDHVMVRARIDGRTYWLDGTRLDDANLDVLTTPNYRWALPVQASGAALEPLQPTAPVLPLYEKTLKIDARAGLHAPAAVHVDLTMRGDVALAYSLVMKQVSGADRDRALRNGFTSDASWLKADKVGFTYDPVTAVAHATLDGSGVAPFSSGGGKTSDGEDWQLDDSSLGSSPDLSRVSPYHHDAPFAVAYPDYQSVTVEVELPDGGRGFSLYNAGTLNQTVGGVAFSRAAAITGDRMVMVASHRALGPEFPASDASSVTAALHDLYAYDITVHYAPPTTVAPASTDSALPASGDVANPILDEVHLGETAFLAHNFTLAVEHFTRAIATHPTSRLYYNRGASWAAFGHIGSARADFGSAISLDPKNALALIALGRLDLDSGQDHEAASLFGRAQQGDAPPKQTDLMIADAYDTKGRFADAAPYWNRMVDLTASPEKRAAALNNRCWLRGMDGMELKQALADCNESLRLNPDVPATLDSRGFVELRLEQFDPSIADYTRALDRTANVPTSLFGRGLAESRRGHKERADADFIAARKIEPKIADKFAEWGVKP